MVSELIGKYIWLIQILSAAGPGGLSLKEITSKYERRYSQDYSRRTFNNHRIAAEEVFGIDIECDRSTNRYYIPYGEEAMDNDASIGWLVSTFTVNSLLTLGKERLSGRVAVEDVPSGQKYLTTIMQAMEESKEMEIQYAKYKSSVAETLHIQPFAVKEHERRWYLVAFCRERASSPEDIYARNDDRSAWRVYALDRIVSLKETLLPFKMPKKFDVDEIFSQSYGIFFPQPGQEPVRIRIRATEEEAKYLRDLPLHSSQKEEVSEKDPKGVIFSFFVIPNQDLVMEFCRHGSRIEVLEPKEVRDTVAGELKKASRQYR